MKIYILKIESVILKHDLVKYKLRTYLSCLNHYIDMTPNQFLPNVLKKWKVNGAKQVSYFGQKFDQTLFTSGCHVYEIMIEIHTTLWF